MMLRGRTHAAVAPLASKSKQLAKVESSFFSSVASLTTSQLDVALIEMLNLRKDGKSCQANPITRAGKRIQLLRMISVALVPITFLLGMVGYILFERLHQYRAGQEVRETLNFSIAVSDLVHSLQKERDISALYVSDIGSDTTKAALLAAYRSTDNAFSAIHFWAVRGQNEQSHFRTKEAFKFYLNKHRYELDTSYASQKSELTFYTELVNIFMMWFNEAILESQTGAVWKQLVALHETMVAKEMFGTERAYGSIYYIRGGFESAEDYLKFVESQDVANASLQAAREYSTIANHLYQTLVAEQERIFVEIIRPYRHVIRKNPFPLHASGSEREAVFWFENMTLYLDAMLGLQRELGKNILDALRDQEALAYTEVVILSVVMVFVILVCPVILKAVVTLTRQIQNVSTSLADRTKALNKEKRRTDSLLYEMLPRCVAEQLKRNKDVAAEKFAQVTILFSDIIGFTAICASSSPMQVVNMLDDIYTCFDDRMKLYDVYKVETIGDAYMVASGLPKRNGKRHAAEVGTLALDWVDHIGTMVIAHMPEKRLSVRIGCHTGPVVAGVVGVKMPHYCIFGETVFIASQMEQSGAAGQIHISNATHALLTELGEFVMEQCRQSSNKERSYWLIHREGMVRLKSGVWSAGESYEEMNSESESDVDYNIAYESKKRLDDVKWKKKVTTRTMVTMTSAVGCVDDADGRSHKNVKCSVREEDCTDSC